MAHLKLHIPGPVEINEKTWQALRTPMIGHRSKDFQDLYAKVMPQLQQLLRLLPLQTAALLKQQVKFFK